MKRLDAYVAYIAAASSLFSAAAVWAETGTMTAGGFMECASDKSSAYTSAFWRVSMLAKEPLRRHLRDVHTCVERVAAANLPPNVVGDIAEQSMAARAAFSSAAKAELGIS